MKVGELHDPVSDFLTEQPDGADGVVVNADVPEGVAGGGDPRVQVNGGKPIVIGTSKEVRAPASFRVTATHKWKWPAVFLYRGGKDDRPWHSIETTDCVRVSASGA